MSISTLLVVVAGVALFGVFAGTLAWAQQQLRPAGPVPAKVFRNKRRPF